MPRPTKSVLIAPLFTPAGGGASPGATLWPRVASRGSTPLVRTGDKWTVLVITTLADGPPLRFTTLHERIAGVSRRMLSRRLRALTRDGLVTRTAYAEVPRASNTRSPHWGDRSPPRASAREVTMIAPWPSYSRTACECVTASVTSKAWCSTVTTSSTTTSP
ncbi:winged helix-turn-helix transcriptional regulator [Streptomyces sp. NPDC058989]|uniref:winged helix-turn-helix transcriptional regulator n=1 Tax=Streptomyces sp. NPDC058989 TaxID=3346686 RepID=UPI003697C82D